MGVSACGGTIVVGEITPEVVGVDEQITIPDPLVQHIGGVTATTAWVQHGIASLRISAGREVRGAGVHGVGHTQNRFAIVGVVIIALAGCAVTIGL